jgi:formylglycine-generating enzyme required for sulfatase activity
MADIFVSYTRADQEIVGRIVALLEAQGWSVWWDTRIAGGERWDATIEREINAARCVVVVWTPRSINQEWVHLEAHHGRSRGILVPILVDIDKAPFAFSLIQAREITGWDGATKTAAVVHVLNDVQHKLGDTSPRASSQPQPPTSPTLQIQPEAEREWRAHDLENCDDPGLLRAYAAKWDTADRLWSYKAQQRAAGLEAAQQRWQAEGCVKVDAKIIHGAPGGWFKPGAGRIEWFKDHEQGPEMVVVPAGEFIMGSNERERERPQHKVTIKAPFAVGRYAVTIAEANAAGLRPWTEAATLSVTTLAGSQPLGLGLRREKEEGGWPWNCSWDEAKAYASWLSQKTRREYRLLSEAEWEYCCRAGTTTKYFFGDTLEQAQFVERGWGAAKESPRLRLGANAWGLYDTNDGIGELCEDSWHGNYESAPQDGSVWRGGDASYRVLRGCFLATTKISRSALRYRIQSNHSSLVGFRLSRTL